MRYEASQTATSQRGAELVEFILTLPLILAVAFLLIELGVAIMDQAAVTNASRAAARAAILGEDADAAAARVFTSTISWSKEDSPPTLDVNVVRGCGTQQRPVPGCPITATVTYDFDFLLVPAFLGGMFDIDLTAATVMREMNF